MSGYSTTIPFYITDIYTGYFVCCTYARDTAKCVKVRLEFVMHFARLLSSILISSSIPAHNCFCEGRANKRTHQSTIRSRHCFTIKPTLKYTFLTTIESTLSRERSNYNADNFLSGSSRREYYMAPVPFPATDAYLILRSNLPYLMLSLP